MKHANHSLSIVAFTVAGLAIVVCLAVLSSGAMLFYSEAHPDTVRAVLMALIIIGVAAIILDLSVVLRTVREWSWRNVVMIGLTVTNLALTSILVFLFRYFSKPIAGTGFQGIILPFSDSACAFVT
jgi:hypothetical protein